MNTDPRDSIQSNPAHVDDRHALLARRAVRQQLAAKRTGDDHLARLYGQLAAEHIDRHLAARRARLP